MAKTKSDVSVKQSKGGGSEPAPQSGAGSQDWYTGTLDQLRHRVDRLFEDFAGGIGLPWRSSTDLDPFRGFGNVFETRVPSVDFVEKDDAFTVTAEMPGMTDKDIDVSVSDDTLTIKGEKKEEREEKDKHYFLSERRYGSFQRSFRLPASVDRDSIDAQFENGVLTVSLPKSREAKARQKKIAVKSK